MDCAYVYGAWHMHVSTILAKMICNSVATRRMIAEYIGLTWRCKQVGRRAQSWLWERCGTKEACQRTPCSTLEHTKPKLKAMNGDTNWAPRWMSQILITSKTCIYYNLIVARPFKRWRTSKYPSPILGRMPRRICSSTPATNYMGSE